MSFLCFTHNFSLVSLFFFFSFLLLLLYFFPVILAPYLAYQSLASPFLKKSFPFLISCWMKGFWSSIQKYSWFRPSVLFLFANLFVKFICYSSITCHLNQTTLNGYFLPTILCNLPILLYFFCMFSLPIFPYQWRSSNATVVFTSLIIWEFFPRL